MMPSGNVPQYDNLRCTLPKNNINSHVAGNVAIKKITSAASSARIMTVLHPPPRNAVNVTVVLADSVDANRLATFRCRSCRPEGRGPLDESSRRPGMRHTGAKRSVRPMGIRCGVYGMGGDGTAPLTGRTGVVGGQAAHAIGILVSESENARRHCWDGDA